MDHITYDYYRIFYYVAKYRSISLAAEILHSNQPNVSKFISKLEQQLGCRLMVRSNRGITLTPEGEGLFAHVSLAYAQLKEAERELIGSRPLRTGFVRISATEIALHGILLHVFSDFRRQFPSIRLLITNNSTPEAVQTLQKGLADFAVVTSPVDVPSGFDKTVLSTFREILVASASSAFLEKRVLSPQEIVSLPVIGLGRYAKTYTYYSRLFLAFGVEWQPDIEVATADMVLPMIEAGLGIGFLPEFMAEQALAKGRIVPIEITGISPKREIVLMEDGSRNLSAAALELKKLLLHSL